MPYIVTGNCEGCKFTDCVTVCPVDCFHEGDTMLYIDPEECIDCGACVDECPVQAIYAEDDVPKDEEKWIAINAEMSPKLPVITDKKDPLPGAEERKTELGL
jgi:ferredoxin